LLPRERGRRDFQYTVYTIRVIRVIRDRML
jgi:hypothetical protein